MVLNQRITGRAMSMPGGLAAGGMCSLLVTLGMTAILAWVVEGERLPEGNIGYGIMVMLLSASYLGAVTAKTRIKRQRLLVCGLSGLIYFGILLSITALFFGGQYRAVGVTALLVLCGSMLAALPGTGQGRQGKQKKYKLPHR